jgi:hypothetical protein
LEEKEAAAAAAAQEEDSDLDEGEHCSWCFDRGVTVFCCDTCPRGFCAECITQNLGEQARRRVERADPWECYACKPRPLLPLRKIYEAPSRGDGDGGVAAIEEGEQTAAGGEAAEGLEPAAPPPPPLLERNQVLIDQLMDLEDQIESEAKELEPLRVELVEAEVRAELRSSDGEGGLLEARVREEMALWRQERKAAHRALDFRIKLLQEILPPLLPKGCSLISVYWRREKYAARQDQEKGDPWGDSVVRVKPDDDDDDDDDDADDADAGEERRTREQEEQPGFWRVGAAAEPSWAQAPLFSEKLIAAERLGDARRPLPALDEELPIYAADTPAELIELGVEGGDTVEEIGLESDMISSSSRQKGMSRKKIEKAYAAEERAAKDERARARRRRRQQERSGGGGAAPQQPAGVRRLRSKLVEKTSGPPAEVDSEDSEPELDEFVEEQGDSSSESDSSEDDGQQRRRKRKRNDSGSTRRERGGGGGGGGSRSRSSSSRGSSWKRQPLQAPDSLTPAWQGSDSPWKGKGENDAPFVINTAELEAYEQACEDAGDDEGSELQAPKSFVVHPKLACQLKTHQREGVRFLWDQTIRGNAAGHAVRTAAAGGATGCILGHCMGLGKTLQVVTIVHTVFQQRLFGRQVSTAAGEEQTLPACVLVVAPKNVVYNWRDEFTKWAGRVKVYLVDSDMERRRRNLQVRSWHNTGMLLASPFHLTVTPCCCSSHVQYCAAGADMLLCRWRTHPGQ